jgi:hypothetical protein
LKERKSDRVALIQRSLIDLIDFLDAERIRFPEVNERGKVNAPGGFRDRKRLRPANEIARFRSDGDPGAILVAWAEEHRTSAESAAGEYAVKLPAVGRLSRTSLLARRHQSWFEISLQRAGQTRPAPNIHSPGDIGQRTLDEARPSTAPSRRPLAWLVDMSDGTE